MSTEHVVAPRGRIAGVILAGGDSTRMGSPKALLAFEGRTFLQVIVERLTEAGTGQIVVVAGSAAAAIRKQGVPRGAELAINPAPENGQLSSLQVGVRALAKGTPAAIVCLVDHPSVAASSYVRLIQAWRLQPGSIVLPRRNGKHGHPIVIDRRYFGQLLELPPEATMRAIVRQNDEETLDVDLDDPGINRDVDTPEDYRALTAPGD